MLAHLIKEYVRITTPIPEKRKEKEGKMKSQ